jgi:hypothetical protein
MITNKPVEDFREMPPTQCNPAAVPQYDGKINQGGPYQHQQYQQQAITRRPIPSQAEYHRPTEEVYQAYNPRFGQAELDRRANYDAGILSPKFFEI